MSTFLHRIGLLSGSGGASSPYFGVLERSPDVAAWQGAATDGTHYYVTAGWVSGNSSQQWVLYKLDSSFAVVDSVNTSAYADGTHKQINGVYYDSGSGSLYVCANNHPTTPAKGWVIEVDPSDLSEITYHDLGAVWTEAVAPWDGSWWQVDASGHQIRQYNSSFVFVDTHALPDSSPGALYWSAIFVLNDIFYLNHHDWPTNPLRAYTWNGSGFDSVATTVRRPSGYCTQAAFSDGTNIWWAERLRINEKGLIVKSSAFGAKATDAIPSSATWWLSHSMGVVENGVFRFWRDVIGGLHGTPASTNYHPPDITEDGPNFDNGNTEYLQTLAEKNLLGKRVFVRFKTDLTQSQQLVSHAVSGDATRNLQFRTTNFSGTGNIPKIGVSTANSYYGAANHFGATTLAIDTWYLAEFNARSTGLDVWLNGGSEISTTAGTKPGSWFANQIGTTQGGSQSFDGLISDIVVANASITGTEITNIRDYLNSEGASGVAPSAISNVENWLRVASQMSGASLVPDQRARYDGAPPTSISQPGIDASAGLLFAGPIGGYCKLWTPEKINILGGYLYVRHKFTLPITAAGVLFGNSGFNVQLRTGSSNATLQLAASPSLYGSATHTSSSDALSNATWQVSRWNFRSDGFDVDVDGSNVLTVAAAGPSDLMINQIGARETSSEPLTGLISDVVFLPESSSSADRIAVAAYLASI